MVDSNLIYDQIISLLSSNNITYKVFSHKPAFSYEELAEVQKQTGFFGAEMKCLVLKSESNFLVYITLQGNKLNFNKIKDFFKIDKLKLASSSELKENFGAEPGCAYPFGFSKEISIIIDPAIYFQEWLLFSPALPSETIQVKAKELKNVFLKIKNKTVEMSFNL